MQIFSSFMLRAYAMVLGTALLAGCSLHNIDPSPKAPVQEKSAYDVEMSDAYAPRALSWWLNFERPALNDLMQRALQNNQDLAQARARLEQAQALARRTSTERLPLFGVEGAMDDRWNRGDNVSGTSRIGGTLSWDLDLFNRIGAQTLSDELEAQAKAEELALAKLSMSGEIARAYFGAAAAHRRLSLLRQQVRVDKELLELLTLRRDQGVGTNVDVLQQQSRVSESETLIPTTQADLRFQENRLDVLLGIMPDGENRVAGNENLAFDHMLPPIGVPADLLLERPDLRAARTLLVAADADIAAAIADRLPDVTLDGSYNYSDTATSSGPVGLLTGMFIQPLLDWGRRKAEVERNEAVYSERLAAFALTYIQAVEEVENTLYAEKKQREFIRRLIKRRDVLKQTADEARTRYERGIDDYLPVLNALQELRIVQRELITARLRLVELRIALHQAIGGNVTMETDNYDTP